MGAAAPLRLRLQPHQTLLELHFAESIKRFSLDTEPVPELPKEWVLDYPHECRRDC